MGTGIVRRIDELGRIVIPKELRRTMHLNVGDEMEIEAVGDSINLKKFNNFESVKQVAERVTKLLAETTGADAMLVDTSRVVLACGEHKRNYQNQIVAGELKVAIASRRAVVLHGEDLKQVFEGETADCCYLVFEPIVSGGDVFGGVAILVNNLPSDVSRAYLKFCAELMGASIA